MTRELYHSDLIESNCCVCKINFELRLYIEITKNKLFDSLLCHFRNLARQDEAKSPRAYKEKCHDSDDKVDRELNCNARTIPFYSDLIE